MSWHQLSHFLQMLSASRPFTCRWLTCWQSAAPWSVGKMVWPINLQEKGKDVPTVANVDSRDCALFSFLVSTHLFYSCWFSGIYMEPHTLGSVQMTLDAFLAAANLWQIMGYAWSVATFPTFFATSSSASVIPPSRRSLLVLCPKTWRCWPYLGTPWRTWLVACSLKWRTCRCGPQWLSERDGFCVPRRVIYFFVLGRYSINNMCIEKILYMWYMLLHDTVWSDVSVSWMALKSTAKNNNPLASRVSIN